MTSTLIILLCTTHKTPSYLFYHYQDTERSDTIKNYGNDNDFEDDISLDTDSSLDDNVETGTVHVQKTVTRRNFDERFRELLAYKEKNGHCNVPFTTKKDATHYSLGNWCVYLRKCYRGKKGAGNLTTSNIRALEGIGFQWKILATFDDRFKDLLEFKKKNGHCNVPQTRKKDAKYHSLGGWCAHLRKAYKGKKVGLKLTTSNIRALEGIGFQWTICKSFEDWYKELLAFKLENGHCNVSQHDCKYKALYRWCSRIRMTYRKDKTSQRYRLTRDNIRDLKEIGFRLR